MEDGRAVDAANVVWCTGYRPAFDWVHVDAFDEVGLPIHDAASLPSPACTSSACSFSPQQRRHWSAASPVMLNTSPGTSLPVSAAIAHPKQWRPEICERERKGPT